MNSDFKPAPAAADEGVSSIWSPSRRRPAFLLILVIALILFLLWLPDETRRSLWHALTAQRGLVVLLLIFALVTLSLVWAAGQQLDVWVFTSLNSQSYPLWLDRLMWLVTQLGNMLSALTAAVILFVLRYRRLSVELVFGTLTLWLLVEMVKALSDRDRPFLAIEKTRVVGWREIGDSFPSGHTSQVFFMVTLLVHAFRLGAVTSIVLYAVAALVGITRIYVGAHYPRDVVAGVMLGSVWGILATLVDQQWLTLRL